MARMTVAGAFLAMAVVFGATYSFGAFFDALSTELGGSAAATATVFSITTFTFLGLGAVTGPIADRVGARPLVLAAAGLLGGGLWATAATPSVVVAYATFGAGVGLAAACGYIPPIAAVGRRVTERQPIALGIAISGIGVGTLTATPLAAWLIEEVGWRSAFRWMGTVGALALVVAAVAIGPRADVPPGGRRGAPSLRDPTLGRLFAANATFTVPLFVPFVFVPTLAVAEGVPPVAASLLVGLLGGGSILARLGSGPAIERLGSLRTFRACFALHAAAYPLWWLAGGSYPLLVAFVLVLGIAYGGFVAVSASVAADGFGSGRMGATLGVLYGGAAFGSLIGPPLAGRLLDATGSRTLLVVALTGMATVAWVLLRRVPMDHTGRPGRA